MRCFVMFVTTVCILFLLNESLSGRRIRVYTRHVNIENGRRTTHFGGQCSFPLIICSSCNISVLWLFTVTFDDTKPPRKAVNCNMNSTLLGRLPHLESFIWKVTNSLNPLGEKRSSAGKINLNVGTTTKELETWQSWESNDRTSCEYLYCDKATPVAQGKAISDRLRNPRRYN